jgi:hypothetical protein
VNSRHFLGTQLKGLNTGFPEQGYTQTIIAPYISPMTADWHWKINANTAARAANPTCYWFHTYYGTPRYLWDEFSVSEEEYRANARPDDVAFLDKCLHGADQDS